MIISCEACGTTFKLKANLLKATGTTVRCSKCEHVFTAFPQTDSAASPAEFRADADARMPYEQPISEDFYRDAEETERELDAIFDETAMEDDEDDFGGSTEILTDTGEEETSDLESVMETDMAEFDAGDTRIFDDTEEGLFEDFESGATESEYDAGSEGIGIESLEETSLETVGFDDLTADEDIISFEDLTSTDEIVGLESLAGSEPEADAEIDLDNLEKTSAEDEVDLDALEKTAAEEEIDIAALQETAAEEEVEFDALEKTSTEDEVDLDALEKTAVEDDAEEGTDFDMFGDEAAAMAETAEFDLETEEESEPVPDEPEALDQQLSDGDPAETLDWGVQPEGAQGAGHGEQPEAEGGVVSELDDLDKKPESEKPPKETGDGGQSGGTEEFDLEPFDTDEEAFDLDLDLEPEAGGEAAESADDLDLGGDLNFEDLDLDLEITEEESPAAGPGDAAEESADEFDLDLEATSEEDLGLDLDLDEFDLDLEEPAQEAESEADEFDLDLDFDAEGAGATAEASAGDEFELDLEEDGTVSGEEFDLDLDLEEEGPEADGAAADEFELDLEPASDDLPETAETEADEFDLDLDFDAEGAGAAAQASDGEEFELDLDEAPAADAEFDLDFESAEAAASGSEAAAEDSLDFDLDLEEGDEPAGATAEVDNFELDLDLESEEEAKAAEDAAAESATAAEDEEFDLTDVEDFLDVEEAPAAQAVTEEEDFDLGLETAADVSPTEFAEEAEFDIDLETMLDEESLAGAETAKEVSLETVGARQPVADEPETARPVTSVADEEIAAAPAAADLPEEAAAETDTYAADADVPAGGKRRRPVLWVVFAAVLLALLAAGAYFFLYGQKTAEVQDVGKLQIEISTPEYRFVNNNSAGELLVVTGTVTNRYGNARKNIEVQGNLYDASGKLIGTATAFAGNTFTPEELKTYDLARIARELTNRKGDNGMNVGVKPNEKIPFTVVFSRLPDAMDELSVEVVASAKN